MTESDGLAAFRSQLHLALKEHRLHKITLSKPIRKRDDGLRNIYGRSVSLKGGLHLQLTYRYDDREEVKNYAPVDGARLLEKLAGTEFLNGNLFTDCQHLNLMVSRKGKARLMTRPTSGPATPNDNNPPNSQKKQVTSSNPSHDRVKHRDIPTERPYLRGLGITNKEGIVLPGGKRKYKQINKFVEIIDGLVKAHPLPAGAHVVDMGSGSGYLTFALYDHLVNSLKLKVSVTGVELRPKLVEKCRRIAEENNFDGLRFVEGYIGTYVPDRMDMMIALHACDTATDDALAQAVQFDTEIMVVAPCCQKQVRRDMDVPAPLKPLLKNGILLERQAAMLTDGLRALLLEARGYGTKVFEFIPLEHTAKNVMITATRAKGRSAADVEIATLKETFGVQRHYLEEKLAAMDR